MASGGSDLSTRTSSGDQNRSHMQDHEAALEHFRKCKVDISDAIQRPFPFFELLRDRGFITNETYEESRRKRNSVQEVVYDVLTELEEKFDLSLLRELFSKVMMKNYPNLKCIYKSFRDVILDKNFFPEIDDEELEERSAIEPNMEQGDCDHIKIESPDKNKGEREVGS
ncbi:PREDICTED: nuclear body protein SP140-like protein [Hipposideros armiger]|uniref:Nuclear body protein SP140-like protein n=1 Tax=Hipposideros armiger TaxID=186990 RepID=A0A8B7QN47_HIPAR|nr:PREDICTED: nuclear body protein SP140-like protein [Hipposideros armiger]